MQAPGTSFRQALENYHEKIERCKPVIDVGFHIGVTDLREGGTLEDLAKLPNEGITSYKLLGSRARHGRRERLQHGGRRRERGHDHGHAENGQRSTSSSSAGRRCKTSRSGMHGHGDGDGGRATNRATSSPIAGAPSTCHGLLPRVSRSRSPARRTDVHGETCTSTFRRRDRPPSPASRAASTSTPPAAAKEHRRTLATLAGDVLSVVRPTTAHQVAQAEGLKGQSSTSCRTAAFHRTDCTCSTPRRPARPDLAEPVRGATSTTGEAVRPYPRKGTSRRVRTRNRRWDPRSGDDLGSSHHSNVTHSSRDTDVVGPEVGLVRGQVASETTSSSPSGRGQFSSERSG